MPTSKSRTTGLLRAAALLLLALLILAPLLCYPFARDHGMYMVVAETISRGGMPYADAWDLKTPGIFVVFRAALGLFGRNMWGVRVLELLFLSGTALALCRLGNRLDPGRASGPLGAAFFLLFLGHHLNYWHTSQAESFLMLPLVLSIDFAVQALDQRHRRPAAVRAVLSGCCLGLVFIFKFPNILPIACCLPLLFLGRARGPGEDPPPKRSIPWPATAWFAAGAFLPLLVTAAWFTLGGALGDLVQALFVFAPRYAGVTVSGALLVHGLKVFAGFFLPGQGLMLPKLLCLSGLAICLLRGRGGTRLVLPLWFVLSLAVIWIQGKFFLYHYLPLYLPCALLAGVAADRTARALSRRVRGTDASRRRSVTLFSAVLLLLPFLLDAGTLRRHWGEALSAAPVTADGKDLGLYRDGTDFSLAADLAMADYLRRSTKPHETVYIWGYETLVYFLADRSPASRFITHQPLASRWQMPGWRDELLSDLSDRRPARILVLRRDAMPALTGSTLDSAGLLREFPELERFITRHYRLETEIEDFLVYGPRDAGRPAIAGTEGSNDAEH